MGGDRSGEQFSGTSSGSLPHEPPRRENSHARGVAEDLDALLVGHCRHATTELPPGKPGARWAAEVLASLPTACRRGLPDVTATGPKLFEFLVEQGLLVAVPSARLVPAVLTLVTGVSPLLQRRSARQWTLWLARVRDPGSPVLTAIRKRTPASQIGTTVSPPTARALRSAALRAERDQLLAELTAERSTNEHLRQEKDRLTADLDRVSADLTTARTKIAGGRGGTQARPYKGVWPR